MPSHTPVFIFAAATALSLSVAPAPAQQVLVCYTLHNDLANFDRRAHQIDPYLWRSGVRTQEAYDRSYLGGSDVIRLRIINEMRRFGCPLPPDAFLLEESDRRKSTITLPLK